MAGGDAMTETHELGGRRPIECSRCGAASPPGSHFCGACGASLAEALLCAACGSENPAAHRFCSQCGTPLPSVSQAEEASAPTPPSVPVEASGAPGGRDPRASIPPHLAEKIRASRAQLEGERKQVTVLFADVMGSMGLAEQTDPEEFRALMDRVFAILSEGVHRFEGTVDKFTGDGIMALFGAPIAHEDHAQRACFAALHLHDQLAESAAELRRTRGLNLAVRMGLNSGEVVVGSIGDDLEVSYTAVGRTVGLAQRMEQLAEPGKAYVTDTTAKLVEGYLSLADLGDFEVKGVTDPVRVHELVGVGFVRTRIDLARVRGFSRFVGRDEEMRELDAALDRAVAGEAQIVGIVGEPGVGKSRLCHEFGQRCQARGLAVYKAQGQAHARAIPFLPVLQMLRGYFGIVDDDSDRTARERIAGKLLLLDERFADDLPLLFDFLAVPDPQRPPPKLNPEARQRQLLDMVKRLVRAQGESEPTVNLLEDLHWVDPGTELFLAALVQALPGTRGLTVVNFRPEYRAEWMAKSYYRQIPLAPLDAGAVGAMLGDILGSDPSLDGLPDLVAERTAGNPFFVEELVQSLVEAGNLEGTRGSYRLVRSVDHSAVPASVQAVLAARIDRLAERDKVVLQSASVIGREFSQPVLAAASGLGADDVEAALRELVATEYVYEQALYPHPEYAFKHPLTREVAYGSMLGDRRARAHAAVATAIEEQSADRIEERAALIAQHRDQAGEPLEAARWYARAAGWAGFNDPSAALEHWRRVMNLTRELSGDEATSLALSARLFILQLAWRLGVPEQETEELFAEAKELAQERNDLASLTVVLATYSTLKGVRGHSAAYLELSEQALASARQVGDPALQVVVGATVGYALHNRGRSKEAAQLLEELVRLCEDDPDLGAGTLVVSPFAFCVSFQGFTLAWLGVVEEAATVLERGRRLARDRGDSETLAWNHMWTALLGYYTGDDEGALAHARRGAEIAERIGDSFSRAWARASLGLAHMAREEWRQAADALEGALSLSRERGVALEGQPLWLALLAATRAGLRERVAARQLVAEALACLSQTEAILYVATGGRLVAQAMVDINGAAAAPEARPVLERALARAVESGLRGEEALIKLERARLERLVGNRAVAARLADDGLRSLIEIGAERRVHRVQRELQIEGVQQ